MQKLLHGRMLYVLLALFVGLLYVRAMSSGHMEPNEPAPKVQPEVSTGWWPQELDSAGLHAVAARHPHVAVALSVLVLVGAGMAAAGLGLTLRAMLTGRTGALWRFQSAALPRWSFGELGRILALVIMTASLVPFIRIALAALHLGWEPDHHVWLTCSMLLLDGFAILTIATFAQPKRPSLAEALGFGREHRWRAAAAALRDYVTLFPWLFLMLFLSVETAKAVNFTPPAQPIHELVFAEHRPWVFALTVLLACIVGPLAEELLFRGVMYPAIRHHAPRLVAMLISGGIFAGIHTNILGFLPIMALGCLLAYVYERTGTLAAPLAVHVVHNALLMGAAMVLRHAAALAGS
jgi:hypothetical protein